MMAETVEAIQAYLPGLGWILYPSVRGFAPGRIDDQHLMQLGESLRTFDEPNRKGKMFKYRRNEIQKCYILVGPA